LAARGAHIKKQRETGLEVKTLDIVLIVIGAVILNLLVLLVLTRLRTRGRKRCRDCRHFAEQYITSLHGQGLFRFGYCQLVIYDTPIVEPDIGRVCDGYEVLEVLEEVTKGMPEAETEQRAPGGQ